MRYIYLLLLTFIFAACGNQKIRFVRTPTEKQKVIDVSEVHSLKKPAETSFSSEKSRENSATEKSLAALSTKPNLSDEIHDEPIILPKEVDSSFPETVQDSVTITSEEANAIADEALRAEKFGTRSLVSSIFVYALQLIGVFLLIISFGAFEVVLLVFALFLGSIVALILGILFGSKSLKSRYNTPKGRRRAIIGLILCGIPLIYLLVIFISNLF